VFPIRSGLALVLGLLASWMANAAPAVHPHPDASAAMLPTLKLEQAVDAALRGNPGLAQFAYQLKARSARVDAAGLRPAPEFNSQLENVLGTGRTRGFSGAEASFALSQLIELGDPRGRRVDAARVGVESVVIARQAAQLDVLAEVSRRFIHVASDQEQLRLTHLATELAEKTVREVQRRVRAAKSPEVELHRARIVLSRAQVEHEHAEHELLTSRRKLAAMWGEREVRFGEVEADLFALPQVGDFEELSTRLAASPDFLRFATEARQRDAELRLAQARARSHLTLSAGLRRLQDSNDTAFIAGVSLPLFGQRQARPAIAEAQALRAEVDAESAVARLKAETQLFELVQELKHSITEAEMLRDQVLPQMEEALRETEYAWQRGRYGYLEWAEAQRERVAVQRALIEAAANAQLFHTEIERLTGAPVTEGSGAARREQDHRHAEQGQAHAQAVGPGRADAVHQPQPGQRDADVDAAVGRVDASAGLRVQGQQPDEDGQAERGRQQQPGAAALLEPEPGQVAADDLRQRGQAEQAQ